MKRFALAATGLLLSSGVVWAQNHSVTDNFLRLSSGETVVAPFSSSAGTATLGSYNGFVEVLVGGTGYSYGLNVNDAFYCAGPADWRCSGPGAILDPQYYQLNIGFGSLPFSGGESNNIANYITFIDGIGSVPGATIPAYQATHVYHFVLDLNSFAPSALNFGISDGIYSDNGGEFFVQVFQLAPIPEPETYAMMFGGLGLLGFMARRRKQLAA